MSLLDKDVMYYFRDEIEKTALIVPLAAGVGKIVAGAGQAAGRGASAYGKFMTNLAAGLGHTGPITGKHLLGGTLLGAGGVYAATRGGMLGEGALAKYKKSQQEFANLGSIQRTGDIL